MSVETRCYFGGYNVEMAQSLLGPANLGEAEPHGCCDHLALFIQNIVTVIFRIINYIFGDHQWYNNHTALQILQGYNLSCLMAEERHLPPLDGILIQKMTELFDALSLRANNNGPYILGLHRPILRQNEDIESSTPGSPLAEETLSNNERSSEVSQNVNTSLSTETVPSPYEVFKETKILADQGDIPSQVTLAYYYENGEGTDINLPESFRYMKMAADQGHLESQYNVAECYQTGHGTAINLPEAFKYMGRAADQNDVESQYRLAVFFHDGKGTKFKPWRAFEYMEKAANQGHGESQCELGFYYLKGIGTKANPQEALRYTEMAIANGIARAKENLIPIQEALRVASIPRITLDH
jgi:hypothetical protein